MSLASVLNWAGYIFAVIGLLATVYKSVTAWLSLKTFNWKEFDRIAKRVIAKIAADKFYPDVIVTIGRGGAILGAVLSGNLPDVGHPLKTKKRNIPILGTDRLYKWEDGNRIEIPNEMVSFFPLRGKKVLIVAADVLSGGTMEFFAEQISVIQPAVLRTACLVKGITSTFVPNYYGKEIPADFKMPWMYKGFGYSRDSRKPN